MVDIRVLATNLEFPEGPVVMPDGSVVLVEIRGKRLTRVYPDGRKEVVALIPGGPNGAAHGPDGKMYICNTGGFSWIPAGKMIMPGPQPDDYQGGSIQRVDMQSGKVETVVDRCGEHALRGPNDLVFDKHGGLWFSDLGKRRAREMDVGAFYYIKPGMKEIVEAVHGVLRARADVPLHHAVGQGRPACEGLAAAGTGAVNQPRHCERSEGIHATTWG